MHDDKVNIVRLYADGGGFSLSIMKIYELMLICSNSLQGRRSRDKNHAMLQQSRAARHYLAKRQPFACVRELQRGDFIRVCYLPLSVVGVEE